MAAGIQESLPSLAADLASQFLTLIDHFPAILLAPDCCRTVASVALRIHRPQQLTFPGRVHCRNKIGIPHQEGSEK